MNTKQLNRTFTRAMYGMVIIAMVFSVSAVAYAAPESSKLQTDGPPALAWVQVNEDGFGDSQNQQIPSLAVFGNYLYAGTWNAVWVDDNVESAKAQIWRTPDGANWELVNETEANGAAALIVYKGYLYSGSWSNEEWGWGGKVWRSKDGLNWEIVTTDGFGNGNGIARFAVFKNALYASTWGAGTEIWRTTNGVDWRLFAAPGWDYENNGGAISSEVFNGFLYWGVPNWTTGAQIWRTNGVSMEPISTDGFGSTDNSAISSLAAFNDYLYAGVWNSQGVQVWRSNNGTDWEQVSAAGSSSTGDTNNALEVYQGQLYLVVQNNSTGLEVWRTANGIDWEQVGFAGFGDGNNGWSYWDNATTVFKGNLFIATNNFATGGEVWEFCPTGCKNEPVRVPANAEWVSAGIFVEEGQVIHLVTNGLAITAPPNIYKESKSGPDGQVWGLGCGQYEGAPPPCALDDAPYGALIGRVGPFGEPFLIGGSTSFTVPASGNLHLVVNDNLGFYSDNLGGFTVLIRGN